MLSPGKKIKIEWFHRIRIIFKDEDYYALSNIFKYLAVCDICTQPNDQSVPVVGYLIHPANVSRILTLEEQQSHTHPPAQPHTHSAVSQRGDIGEHSSA